jgi:putative RecB family exonuclease
MIFPFNETINERAERLTGRSYLSYSSLSTYRTCPLRYWFHYVADYFPETVSPTRAFGAAFHAALEHYFRCYALGIPVATDDLIAVFHERWADLIADPDVLESRFVPADEGLASRMLMSLLGSDIAKPVGEIIGVEREVAGSLSPDCPDLFGIADLVVDTGEAVVLTDFKTSATRWSGVDVEVSSEQLLVYGELAQEFTDKPIELRFVVVTKTKVPLIVTHRIERSDAGVQRTIDGIRRTWHAIESGHFYPAPSKFSCGGCPYRKACRAWKG